MWSSEYLNAHNPQVIIKRDNRKRRGKSNLTIPVRVFDWKCEKLAAKWRTLTWCVPFESEKKKLMNDGKKRHAYLFHDGERSGASEGSGFYWEWKRRGGKRRVRTVKFIAYTLSRTRLEDESGVRSSTIVGKKTTSIWFVDFIY